MPNYQQEIAKQWEGPLLRPLAEETARYEGQFLPAMFDPFTKMGTGASDMSPAAKLSSLGNSLGRVTAAANVPRNLMSFYGGQIGDLADRMSTDWSTNLGNKWNTYNALFNQEQADISNARAASASSAAAFPAFPMTEEAQAAEATITPMQKYANYYRQLLGSGNDWGTVFERARQETGLGNADIDRMLGVPEQFIQTNTPGWRWWQLANNNQNPWEGSTY